MPDIFKVALIGPESTGKTSLCKSLAEYFHTTWVPEYARSYMENLMRAYTEADVLHCLKMQIEAEDVAEKSANRILFCDTDLIVYKIWLIDVFGSSPQWLDERIATHLYGLHLLTRPDIPFISDPVRENPLRREYFFDLYRKELEKYNFNYSIISGEGDERFKAAIGCINEAYY